MAMDRGIERRLRKNIREYILEIAPIKDTERTLISRVWMSLVEEHKDWNEPESDAEAIELMQYTYEQFRDIFYNTFYELHEYSNPTFKEAFIKPEQNRIAELEKIDEATNHCLCDKCERNLADELEG